LPTNRSPVISWPNHSTPLAETAGIGKILRFSGDVWKNHACCVTFLAERDLNDKPEWSQRVTNAIVKAQLWTRSNQVDTARLLSNTDEHRYTPHSLQNLTKVLATTDYSTYEKRGIIAHPQWNQRRIDFQPFPVCVVHRRTGARDRSRPRSKATTNSSPDSIRNLSPATWSTIASYARPSPQRRTGGIRLAGQSDAHGNHRGLMNFV
jgi:hypothetical protein